MMFLSTWAAITFGRCELGMEFQHGNTDSNVQNIDDVDMDKVGGRPADPSPS